MNISANKRARGFSVIEVLVAVLIFSVALVALARFMGGLMVAGGDAKARALAAALAQEKIEDLRQFNYLEAASGSTSTFGYEDIDSSTSDPDEGGGLKDSGAGWALRVRSGDVAEAKVGGSNVTYALSWTVDDLYYPGGGGDPVAWTPGGPGQPQYSDFKQVSVTVSWVDPSGVDQSLTLPAQINSVEPGTVARSGSPPPERESPQVAYNPGAAPDVIGVPVDLGGGRKKETSKPLPEVRRAAGDLDTHVVKFETVTYDLIGNEAVARKREEFITISCECTLENGTSPILPYGVSRVAWDGGQLIDRVGEQIDKGWGTTTLPANDDLYPLCNVCCRDHHDISTQCNPADNDNDGADLPDAFGCYDMSRPSNDYEASGDHKHYNYNASGNLQEVNGSSPNKEYLEACRMKRVDGIWRIFSDWRLVDLLTIKSDDLKDATQTQADFIDRVQKVVKDEVDTASVPALNTDFSMASGAGKQVQSRAVFLDEMTDTHLSTIQEKIADGELNWLEFVPFVEVNLTLLSQWYTHCELEEPNNPNQGAKDCATPVNWIAEGLYGTHTDYGGDETIATVSNEEIDTIEIVDLNDPSQSYYGHYSRGWVSKQGAGATTITSDVTLSNSGVASAKPIDPDDYDNVMVSSLTVSTGLDLLPGISGWFNSTTVPNPPARNKLTVEIQGTCTDPTSGAAIPFPTQSCTTSALEDNLDTPTDNKATVHFSCEDLVPLCEYEITFSTTENNRAFDPSGNGESSATAGNPASAEFTGVTIDGITDVEVQFYNP